MVMKNLHRKPDNPQEKIIRELLELLNPKEIFKIHKKTRELIHLGALGVALGYFLPQLDRLAFELSKKRLAKFMNNEKSLEDILHTTTNYHGYLFYSNILANQIPSEIKSLAEEVKQYAPHTVVEIGTSTGGTLYIWSRYLNCRRIISINLPTDFFYPEQKIKFFKLFNTNVEYHFLRNDSHNKETVNMLVQILKEDKINFLFIDGDHSYEGVKQDFEMYKQFVSGRGIVAFHDILCPPNNPSIEVHKFWNEVKHKYRSKEIVASYDQKWGGIGVLYL